MVFLSLPAGRAPNVLCLRIYLLCLGSSILWHRRQGLLTMASLTASDQVESPYLTLWEERDLPLLLTWCLEQETQPPLSHKLNFRDTKVGDGRGRGPLLKEPEGCGGAVSSVKAPVEALSTLQLPRAPSVLSKGLSCS